MMLPLYRNSSFTASGRITCEIEHPTLGWIPFTADPNDPEPIGAALFAAMEPLAAAYVPPDAAALLEAERATMVCSRFQARAALMAAELLTAVEAAVSNADAITQLAWAEAVEFKRNSPTITGLATVLELTPTQVDDLFRAAMQIEA